MTPFPLWGDYEGVILFLVFEKCCYNAQMEFTFRKVLVPAYHPQNLFHTFVRSEVLTRQERSVATAAVMASAEHISHYYEGRLWMFLQPPSCKRHLETVLAHENARAITAACLATNQGTLSTLAIGFKKDVSEDSEDSSNVTIKNFSNRYNGWEDTFSEKPHSNKTLAAFYRLLLKQLSTAESGIMLQIFQMRFEIGGVVIKKFCSTILRLSLLVQQILYLFSRRAKSIKRLGIA
jgi:hypothetical protein